MTPSKSKHPLHETSTKPVATGGIPMVEKLRAWRENAPLSKPPYDEIAAAEGLIEQLVESLDEMVRDAERNQRPGGGDVVPAKAYFALSAARGESGK